MGVHDIRDAFNRGSGGKLRCDRALMVYCDETKRQGGAKRDHQLIFFHCTDGKVIEALVTPGADINLVALLAGQKAVENA